MSDKLEMSLEQFAEAVTKENVRLNEHNEKLKGQTKLYFDAFNKAIARIEKLEAALRCIEDQNNYGSDGCWIADSYPDEIASKALEGKDD